MADFERVGTAKVLVLASAPAALATITAAEVTAGIDITVDGMLEELKSYSGWALSRAKIDKPAIARGFKATRPGALTAGDPQFTIYDTDGAVRTVWDALAPDSEVWIVFGEVGIATGDRYRVFPAIVSTREPDDAVAEDTNAEFMVTFALPAAPVWGVFAI